MQQEVTTIQENRVLLRPFQQGDAEESARVWTPESTHMYGGSRRDARRPSVAGRQRDHERIAASGEHHFAIEADGRYIGWLGLRVNDAEQGASYRIGIENPEYWGRGYGTEAAKAVLAHGFSVLGLNRIYGHYLRRNPASGRVLEKIGMTQEGCLRQHDKKWGQFEDLVVCGMLRSEWDRRAGPREMMRPEPAAGNRKPAAGDAPGGPSS